MKSSSFAEILRDKLVEAIDEIASRLNNFPIDDGSESSIAIKALAVLMGYDISSEDFNLNKMLAAALEIKDSREAAVRGLLALIPVAETDENLSVISDIVGIINMTQATIDRVFGTSYDSESHIIIGKTDDGKWDYSFTEKPTTPVKTEEPVIDDETIDDPEDGDENESPIETVVEEPPKPAVEKIIRPVFPVDDSENVRRLASSITQAPGQIRGGGGSPQYVVIGGDDPYISPDDPRYKKMMRR